MDENKNENELEFNKRNREDFEDLMEKSSTNKDGYWDINNPIVKILLIFIGLIILAGSVYYVVTYLLNH
ncbi:MAG: hypothetical protein IJ097_01460 [Bacilli bacterium]|nr:hypothetical protein [Bacilli bacterium]